jgi:hypothetical protein
LIEQAGERQGTGKREDKGGQLERLEGEIQESIKGGGIHEWRARRLLQEKRGTGVRSDEIIDLKELEGVLGLVDEGMGVGGEENVEANRNVISASTVVTFELV